MTGEKYLNSFDARAELNTAAGAVQYFRLQRLGETGVADIARMPFSIRILLESLLRNENGQEITAEDVQRLAGYSSQAPGNIEVPFKPARVLLQDFTGVPCVVDLAAMRSAMVEMGGNPGKINPLIPVDLVIDHSVQVDYYGMPEALQLNADMEFKRNRERYEFLKWGQQAFENFSVIPPASGICHQVNLEHLGQVVRREQRDGMPLAFPDSVVGTDSHTPMINGLGVVGWGVGGIEAEAVMLGQPVYFLAPEVIGVKVEGLLGEGVTATDMVLTITQMLRQRGVVGSFVEFFGFGLANLTVPDRATIANMSPESGSTMIYFPVDDQTLAYLRGTGREQYVDLVERYTKEQGLFRSIDTPDPQYSDVIEFDLGAVVPSLAGPKRPQDRVALNGVKAGFHKALTAEQGVAGFGVNRQDIAKQVPVDLGEGKGRADIAHGSVVIAAITSCTNTSNPSVMIAAGLLAKNAAAKGLRPKPWVKTSLAPGSAMVTDYLQRTGLLPHLEALGFNVVGYGCTTCIGNSGPLAEPLAAAIEQEKLVVASVLSGNRNFEGRINPHTKAGYLASPPLVVAYALAGTLDIDLTTEPLGTAADGTPVMLADIWPRSSEIASHLLRAYDADAFKAKYGSIETGNQQWNDIPVQHGDVYHWNDASTYIQQPPFFVDMSRDVQPLALVKKARVLALLGDTVTTDHISPAGAIPEEMPAGLYLKGQGVHPLQFNTYGSRRGNDRVMTRGTFGNIRLRNMLAPKTEGGWTKKLPEKQIMPIYDASRMYQEQGVPLIVIAGRDYGMGSSRDWAAKGTQLLGVRAVLAQSFERIHRSNLIGMGVLPLQFKPGQSARSTGISGIELFTLHLNGDLKPGGDVVIEIAEPSGRIKTLLVTCRLDTPVEVEYYRNGGILQTVLRRLLKE